MVLKRDPLKTLGGKSQLIDTLMEIFTYCIDEYNIRGICDLFMGGNRLFLHLESSQITFKLANEIDRGIIAFFNCLQYPDKVDQLIDIIVLLADHMDADNFKESMEVRLNEETEEVLAAALTYIVTEYSRAANRKDYCQMNVDKGIDIAKLDKFYNLEEVISGIHLVCGDYEDQFHKYKNKEDFLLWLDPPYVRTKESRGISIETSGYVHSFDIHRQEQLVDHLLSEECKAKVVLCGYKNDIYKRLEHSNKFHCYFVGMVHVPSSATGKKRAEYIWCNFELSNYLLHNVLPLPIYEEDFYY